MEEGEGESLPFGGYGRSHRIGSCSGGVLGVERVIGLGDANHCPYSVEVL